MLVVSQERKETSPVSVLAPGHWDRQYQAGPVAWEPTRPSTELARVLRTWDIRPCRAIELGCGTGLNAVWLAGLGFRVTAIDLSPVAIRRARLRAVTAGTAVRFLAGDLRSWEKLDGPYDFFFDRGCYDVVRLADAAGYFHTLKHITRPGARGLVLAGNAGEDEDPAGPPVVSETEMRDVFRPLFEILQLRPFRFDLGSAGKRYLGWSCLVLRR
jgi:SAM-dependent methyltransferase